MRYLDCVLEQNPMYWVLGWGGGGMKLQVVSCVSLTILRMPGYLAKCHSEVSVKVLMGETNI